MTEADATLESERALLSSWSVAAAMASSKGIFSSLENAERKRQARFARARLRAGARERGGTDKK